MHPSTSRTVRDNFSSKRKTEIPPKSEIFIDVTSTDSGLSSPGDLTSFRNFTSPYSASMKSPPKTPETTSQNFWQPWQSSAAPPLSRLPLDSPLPPYYDMRTVQPVSFPIVNFPVSWQSLLGVPYPYIQPNFSIASSFPPFGSYRGFESPQFVHNRESTVESIDAVDGAPVLRQFPVVGERKLPTENNNGSTLSLPNYLTSTPVNVYFPGGIDPKCTSQRDHSSGDSCSSNSEHLSHETTTASINSCTSPTSNPQQLAVCGTFPSQYNATPIARASAVQMTSNVLLHNMTSNRKKASFVKRYTCDVCGKAFSRSNTLVTHKRIHTGAKPFECDQCGRAFRQPGNLTRHKMTHTTIKPFKCEVCAKAFNRASNLQTHMRTHTNYRPYTCPYCGKGFHQKIDMKVHCYTHTGEKPHGCTICDRRFTQLSHLTCHLRTHSDNSALYRKNSTVNMDHTAEEYDDVTPRIDNDDVTP